MSTGESDDTDLGADPVELLERALGAIDVERVAELCCGLVDIASPTGEERPLAEWIAGELRRSGIDAHDQPIDAHQSNAWGSVGSPGSGPDLLLYAPIDTLTVGTADEDVPWVGPELPRHAVPAARRDGNRIVGLGAHNPKGHAACVMAALEAISAAGVPLRGRVIGGFGAGGMPTNARDVAPLDGGGGGQGRYGRRNTGHGVGAGFLLEQGIWADAAIVAKSGWAVSWEEVGLSWIDVEVRGIHTYVGARHRLPYRNAIVDMGRVAIHLDRWFADYASSTATDLLEPQGIVAAAEAGWWRMAAVTPAVARLRCDVRLMPDQSPLDALRQVDGALEELRTGDDPIDAQATLALAIPGSRTASDHWIVSTAIDAWERTTGQRHQPIGATSGATDANVLRNHGIPTARIGLPKVDDGGAEVGFAEGMNTVDIGALELLTRHLVTTAVLVGTRSRAELGLTVRTEREPT